MNGWGGYHYDYFIGLCVLAVCGVIFGYILVRAMSLAYYRTRSEYDRGEIGRNKPQTGERD